MWIQDLHVESSSCYVGCDCVCFFRAIQTWWPLCCYLPPLPPSCNWRWCVLIRRWCSTMLASFVPPKLDTSRNRPWNFDLTTENPQQIYTNFRPWNLWFHLRRFLMGVLFRAMGFEKLLIWRINVKCWSHEIWNHHKTLQFIVGFQETTSQKISWLCFFLNGRKCCSTWDVHNPVNLGIFRWIQSTWYLESPGYLPPNSSGSWLFLASSGIGSLFCTLAGHDDVWKNPTDGKKKKSETQCP